MSRYGKAIFLSVAVSTAFLSRLGSEGSGGSGDTAGWFPFKVAAFEPASAAANPSPIDLSYLNKEITGEQDRISVKDGHFVSGRGERIRFFATVIAPGVFDYYCDDANKVELLAEQLRRLGFNLVRVWPPFVRDAKVFEKEIAKLDLLVAALKKNGIYINLTLQANYGDFPGSTDSLNMRYWWSNRLDRFYPPFVRIQEEDIRRVLGHKNAITGLTYAEDPAVFCVALNNENSIFPLSEQESDLGRMIEPYRSELERQWNAWLKNKYGSTAKLADALRKRFGGPYVELLKFVNSGNAQHGPGWNVLTIDGKDTTSIGSIKDKADGDYVRWNATKSGLPGWQYSILQLGLNCIEGKCYSVSLEARIDPSDASADCPLAVNVQADSGDYHLIGATGNFALTRDWATYQHIFTAQDVIRGHIQFSLNVGRPGIVDIRNASLKIAEYDLPAGKSLEAGNLSLPVMGLIEGEAWRIDFFDFLAETERSTVKHLEGVLKELHVRSLVFNAQADYGGYYGFIRESSLSDLIDLHGYWDMPTWKDAENPGQAGWTIPNESEVARRGNSTLTRLALWRNARMPFTISEYNTPAPSDYASEMDPMMSSFAAFQDWDAIYSFVYCDAGDNLESTKPNARGELYRNTDRIVQFFVNASHPGKRVFMPAAALVFRLGLVKPGSKPVTLELPSSLPAARFNMSAVPYFWNRAAGGGAQSASAARRMQVRIMDGRKSIPAIDGLDMSDTSPSDTGEILWDAAGQVYSVNAPAVRIALGAIAGKPIRLGDLAIEVGAMKQPYAAVEVVAMDAKPIAISKKLLISVAARVENEGWSWDEGRHYISNWESVNNLAGTRTIAEPVPISIDLPGIGWKVSMLDGSGYPCGNLSTRKAPAGTRFQADNPQTLWYLAEID